MNNKMLDCDNSHVDFDGTLCYSKWPELGQQNSNQVPRLNISSEWKTQ